jgi:hypothetical protein
MLRRLDCFQFAFVLELEYFTSRLLPDRSWSNDVHRHGGKGERERQREREREKGRERERERERDRERERQRERVSENELSFDMENEWMDPLSN